MKISRFVNGAEVEFELDLRELHDAHDEYKHQCLCEDVANEVQEMYENAELTDSEISQIVSMAGNNIDNCDAYFDAYWEMIRLAIRNFFALKRTDNVKNQ